MCLILYPVHEKQKDNHFSFEKSIPEHLYSTYFVFLVLVLTMVNKRKSQISKYIKLLFTNLIQKGHINSTQNCLDSKVEIRLIKATFTFQEGYLGTFCRFFIIKKSIYFKIYLVEMTVIAPPPVLAAIATNYIR